MTPAEANVWALADLRVRAPFPLPELQAATAEDDDLPVLDIRRAEVPVELPGARGAPVLSATDDQVLFAPGVARFLITGGRELVFDPDPAAEEEDLRLYLLGSAMGVLFHQRRWLPLHANAVVVDGQAVAFAGDSGAGKSSLAAWFDRQGAPVLCDDVCLVQPGETATAWRGVRRLKLWREAADAFGHDTERLNRISAKLEKFHLPLPSAVTRSAPLHRLYILERAAEGEPSSIRRLSGLEAVASAARHTYRSTWLPILGLQSGHFALVERMLRSVEVFEVRRAWGFDVFDREVGLIADHLSAA